MPRLNDSSSQPAQRPRRMVRLMSTASIVSSVILFMCAGGCFLLSLIFRADVDSTPAGAQHSLDQIVDCTIPEGFLGKAGITADNPLFRLVIAEFVQADGRGQMIVAQQQPKIPIPQADQQLSQFVNQYVPGLKKISQTDHRTISKVIHGRPAKLEVFHGEDLASTTKYWQLIGQFQGKADGALLILQAEEGFLSEKQMEEFIDSLH